MGRGDNTNLSGVATQRRSGAPAATSSLASTTDELHRNVKARIGSSTTEVRLKKTVIEEFAKNNPDFEWHKRCSTSHAPPGITIAKRMSADDIAQLVKAMLNGKDFSPSAYQEAIKIIDKYSSVRARSLAVKNKLAKEERDKAAKENEQNNRRIAEGMMTEQSIEARDKWEKDEKAAKQAEHEEYEKELWAPTKKFNVLKCGHAPLSKTPDGKPACAICDGPDSKELAPTPDLRGREAVCNQCRTKVPSNRVPPFFSHRPDSKTDSYYCGCRGWD